MENKERYSELRPLLEGASLTQLYVFLYKLFLVKYATQSQLSSINFKLATKAKLKYLTDHSYVSVNDKKVYKIMKNGVGLLRTMSEDVKPQLEMYHKGRFTNVKLLEEEGLPEGDGDEHQLERTMVVLALMEEPSFYIVFYPTFRSEGKPFLVPDGCVIYKKENLVRICFLEVENFKSNWAEYLHGKRIKYETIARDETTYSKWWKYQVAVLGGRMCTADEFGFSVLCFSKGFNADWQGWGFRSL